MMERMSFSSLVWIAAGGLLYTVGVLFYVANADGATVTPSGTCLSWGEARVTL